MCCLRSDPAGAISVRSCSTIAAVSGAGSLRASMLASLATEVLGDQALDDLRRADSAAGRRRLIDDAMQERQAGCPRQIDRELLFRLVLTGRFGIDERRRAAI